MPTYDFKCKNLDCGDPKARYEKLLRSWDSPDPNCPVCGMRLERQPAAPASVWLKNWSEYGGTREQLRKSPGYTPEGVWVTRRETSRNADGSPSQELITSHSEMRRYCRDEGLIPPDDVNPNIHAQKGREGVPQGRWI